MDFFLSEPLLVMVRFGRWDEVFGASRPDPKHRTLVALWHHARGMALAANGEIEGAYAEAMQIRDIMRQLPEDQLAGLNQGRRVLQLAADIVEARAAQAERSSETVARWERAVALADTLAYNEPADWFYPVRHYLGAALLDAGRAREAEAVYRADLARNPNNGWAYFGLWKSLAAQKKKAAARKAERDYLDAWAFADFELERTAF
jgi:tetratricopeptide (TPR) repeat protein